MQEVVGPISNKLQMKKMLNSKVAHYIFKIISGIMTAQFYRFKAVLFWNRV